MLRLLVALDLSDFSAHTLHTALEVAARATPAEVHIMTVIAPGHDEIASMGTSEHACDELRRLVELIGEALGEQPRIEHRPTQPGDVTRTFADISRAAAELGYAPKVPIEVGVRRFVDWYRAQTGSEAPRPMP